MSKSDRPTPVDGVWNLHPEMPRTTPEVPENGHNQTVLDSILETVTAVLEESKLIRESSQRGMQVALEAFDRLPNLERRMNRVEIVAIGACLVNILMLWLHH